MEVISAIVVSCFIILLYFIGFLFDYLNEKCGNYDKAFLRKRKAKLLKRLDKQNRSVHK